MRESAKQQHEVDKANFAAAKAEAKAQFEENRGSVTHKKAKEQAKQSWDDAHMTPAQRKEIMQVEREQQISSAKEREAKAKDRIDAVKKDK